MIIDAILGALQSALVWLAGLFPTAPGLPWAEHIDTVMVNLGALNYFLPIAELAAVFFAVLLVFPFFAGTSLLLWILAQLRGSSSRG